MLQEKDLPHLLSQMDLKPFHLRIEKLEWKGVDAIIALTWNEREELFVAEFNNAPVLRELRYAIDRARKQAAKIGYGYAPLVVVPYLNNQALDLLQDEEVSGIDLSGNGYVIVPGQWWFRQGGYPNRYARRKTSRRIYQGKSALVGRVFLARPTYQGVNEVQSEVLRRGGELSIGQVSKVLRSLEDDLIIVRTRNLIRLAQPEKLLTALVDGYRRPEILETMGVKAVLDRTSLTDLLVWADVAGVRIAGFAPWRYAVAPEAHTRLVVYVESPGYDRLVSQFDAAPDLRFANLIFESVNEPGIFFDLREAENFRWTSPLQVYLELMQGGKREKEIAATMRDEILAPAIL